MSCQRKQRGEKQQKVAPCSGSGKRVTAEQKTAPRHVFPPFSTQQHKLQLRSSPWHRSEDQARSSPRPRCVRNTPQPRAGRQGSHWSTAQLGGARRPTTLPTPNSGCPALPGGQARPGSSGDALRTADEAAWLSLRIRVKYDRLALLKARPQEQNSSFPQPAVQTSEPGTQK